MSNFNERFTAVVNELSYQPAGQTIEAVKLTAFTEVQGKNGNNLLIEGRTVEGNRKVSFTIFEWEKPRVAKVSGTELNKLELDLIWPARSQGKALDLLDCYGTVLDWEYSDIFGNGFSNWRIHNKQRVTTEAEDSAIDAAFDAEEMEAI